MKSWIALFICLHHDVTLRKTSKTWPNEYVLYPYFLILFTGFSYVIKENDALTVVINFIIFVLKNVIKLAKGWLNNIFQDSFNIFLFQQLTHDRSYMSYSTDL